MAKRNGPSSTETATLAPRSWRTAERQLARRVFSIVSRVAISLALLALLIRWLPSFDADELWPDFNSATPFWLIGALVLTVLGNMVATARWHEVASALGLRVKFRRMFSHYMAGMFVSNFVPTTVGGDVLRMSRLSNDTGDGPHSFASVLLERLSGWIVLPVFTLLGLALDEELRGLGRAHPSGGQHRRAHPAGARPDSAVGGQPAVRPRGQPAQRVGPLRERAAHRHRRAAGQTRRRRAGAAHRLRLPGPSCWPPRGARPR